MPTIPLLTNYLNRRAAKAGELPADEYNRNAALTNDHQREATGVT